MNIKNTLLLFIATCAVSLSVWTYIQAQGETISVCVGKTGAMYMVGEGFRQQDCRRNERLMSWSITGPQGPQGEKGDPGTTLSADDFYLTRHGPFEITRSQYSTFGIGCTSPDDIAIAGGPDILNATGGAKY